MSLVRAQVGEPRQLIARRDAGFFTCAGVTPGHIAVEFGLKSAAIRHNPLPTLAQSPKRSRCDAGLHSWQALAGPFGMMPLTLAVKRERFTRFTVGGIEKTVIMLCSFASAPIGVSANFDWVLFHRASIACRQCPDSIRDSWGCRTSRCAKA